MAFRLHTKWVLCFGWLTACGPAPAEIAWVGPASTDEGKEAIRGIETFLAEADRGLKLRIYDDQNDPRQAEAVARKIVKSDAIAVIGHHTREACRAAAPIYQNANIAAISAVVTDSALGREHDGYFRSVSTDAYASRYLAHYIAELSTTSSVTVLARGESEESKGFEDTWRKLRGGPVIQHERAEDITGSMPVVMALSKAESAQAIRVLRQRGFKAPIIGTLEMLSPEFFAQFDDVRDTNGLYVPAPFLFDGAGERAARFRRAYVDRHGDFPEAVAAFSADAAALLAGALTRTEDGDLASRRHQIFEALKAMRTAATGIEGITGQIFFDENGDPPKPISMARLINGQPEVALMQLRTDDVSGKLHPVDVVLTGVRVETFKKIDFGRGEFHGSVSVWFRHRPSVNASDLVIMNAVNDAEIGAPVAVYDEGDTRYRAHLLKPTLTSDYFRGRYGEHVLGISFRHRTLTRDRLVFARDSAGLDVRTARTAQEQLRRLEQLIDPDTGWRARRVIFFEDTAVEHSMGDPRFLERKKKTLDYSRFNIGVAVAPHALSLRRTVSRPSAEWLTPVTGVTTLLLFILGCLPSDRYWRRSRFLLQVISTTVFLISAEVLLGEWLLDGLFGSYVSVAERMFDMLWWLVPAILLTSAIHRFLWKAIEEKSGRSVPTLLRLFVSCTIYLLATFGIIAFVFDQKLTSLLATSGVFAMIIGLAIQINITNIFSGIALNLERPFRVGDWIMVHGRTPEPSQGIIGCVVDINWRTTRLRTTASTLIVIPNGVISEKTITNFMSPTEVSRFELLFHVDASVPSAEVIAAIRTGVQAVVGNNGPLEEPKFKVRIDAPTKDGIQYSVRYFIIPREVSPSKARHSITTSVLEYLDKAGIRLATHPRDIRYREVPNPPVEDL